MSVKHNVFASSIADFLIEDKTFEVGGKNKEQKQNKDVESGYIKNLLNRSRNLLRINIRQVKSARKNI